MQKSKMAIAPSLAYLSRTREIDTRYYDYIRLSTLELISDEINHRNIPGSVAEIGVFKGKFARYLNYYFPDRDLYLFDTFEGFDNRDKKKELKENYSAADQDFSGTSVQQVLAIMPHPEKCIVKKGYFPGTASDVNETFAFVSLDTDLYEPIYNGLVFFYPRLNAGGYIMVHDFNNEGYKGVRDAVIRFCTEQKIGYTPLPDKAGSVVIAK
ncbi:TylF/MycF/NovP-related O-methyltransferase [Taibaiella koreensis]|uniref:TylF/MycF/NovP-related O-methyltransferase n=1 Tax=Taibaiella koreensis TaxID=1268548 RepID=UPI001F0893F5|nr:TylF/MycF/NovP-related O-methyltransferase [Taibaiella koreensis]